MKKLINSVLDVVPDMLQGLALSHPAIQLLQGQNIALRADVDALKARHEVALVSGGGAGHEPAHAGFIGPGLLTAAVVGDVFTSPSADAVLAAIEAVANPAGVLLIIKNYTGDRLNFGLAAEIARSRGIAVETVVVADDAALSARGEHAGRRGLAGTVLVHKVAGAAAAAGKPLAEVHAAAMHAAQAVSTMGVALSPCTVPAAGKPSFTLGDDEIELGLGIHGEPGVQRAPLAPARVLVERILNVLLQDQNIQAEERVALLINNLGGTPAMEMAIVTQAALHHLAQRGIHAERAWTGTFLSALEMSGVSLSLMRLDAPLLAALDAPAEASAWPAAHQGLIANPGRITRAGAGSLSSDTAGYAVAQAAARPGLKHAITQVLDTLEAAEPELTRMDQVVGDGDLGISLSRGAQALRQALPGYPLYDLPATLRAMSATLRRVLGGTSGPLYAIGLLRAAQSLQNTPGDGAAALRAATQGIMEVGGARQGDRTMLDALIPAASAWEDAAGLPLAQALQRAADAAEQGCAATAEVVARRGRSSYLGERALGHPDPGAKAVALWLQALANSC